MVRACLLILILSAAASADPRDTVYDFVLALERGDGYTMETLFSQSLDAQLQAAYGQLQEMCGQQPELARSVVGRMLPMVSVSDIPGMSFGGFLSLLLLQVDASGFDLSSVEREQVGMDGRNATATIIWASGDTLSFQMVWEGGRWRITGSSPLGDIFQGVCR